MDFYQPFARPREDDRHYLRVSRMMTLVWGAVIITIALAAQYLQRSAMELALTVASIPYGSMLGIFLLGVLTRRATSRGALVGALVALATLAYVMNYTNIAWTWYAAIGTVVTFTVGFFVSLVAPDETRVPGKPEVSNADI
jgi:SSS family solute:Na+ symporter